MYTIESVKRKIKKEGIDQTIRDLSYGNFSEDVKKELNNSHIFCDGYPNLSVIYSLA